MCSFLGTDLYWQHAKINLAKHSLHSAGGSGQQHTWRPLVRQLHLKGHNGRA